MDQKDRNMITTKDGTIYTHVCFGKLLAAAPNGMFVSTDDTEHDADMSIGFLISTTYGIRKLYKYCWRFETRTL